MEVVMLPLVGARPASPLEHLGFRGRVRLDYRWQGDVSLVGLSYVAEVDNQ